MRRTSASYTCVRIAVYGHAYSSTEDASHVLVCGHVYSRMRRMRASYLGGYKQLKASYISSLRPHTLVAQGLILLDFGLCAFVACVRAISRRVYTYKKMRRFAY